MRRHFVVGLPQIFKFDANLVTVTLWTLKKRVVEIE